MRPALQQLREDQLEQGGDDVSPVPAFRLDVA